MNIVDWILIGGIVVFALVGWRRGFVAGLFSFVGFFGAGLLASLIVPRALSGLDLNPLVRGLIVGGTILVASFAGQFAAGILGDRISDTLTWRPARALDHVGGAVLNVLVLGVVIWLVAGVAGYLTTSSVTRQINQSKMVESLQWLMPPQTQSIFNGLEGVLQSPSVPTIFAGLDAFVGPDVDPPDPAAVTSAVDVAGRSVVRVFGSADACSSQVSGSGFVVAPNEVMTNAHVVAGVREPKVQLQRGSTDLPATVVYFDPSADIAILRTAALGLPPLALSVDPGATGDDAVVAGFPHSGPFTLEPVRVRTLVHAQADDIYGDAGTMRDTYLLRGSVRKGFSGGPLLKPDGSVMGLVFGADAGQQTTGYALADSEITTALTSLGDSAAPVGTGSCAIRD